MQQNRYITDDSVCMYTGKAECKIREIDQTAYNHTSIIADNPHQERSGSLCSISVDEVHLRTLKISD